MAPRELPARGSLRKKSKPRLFRKAKKSFSQRGVQGRILESLVISPGSRREAQYHSGTAVVDLVVSGEAFIGVFEQKGDAIIRYASEGEAWSIPLGCGHWVENMSDASTLLVLVLANDES